MQRSSRLPPTVVLLFVASALVGYAIYAIAPAAIAGRLLWERDASLPLIVAFAIGVAGTIVFAMTVESSS